MNKYKYGIPPTPAYFGSTTFLVATTDGWHMMKLFRNSFMVIGITFKFGEKQKWYKYITDGAIYYTAYNIGFNTTYGLIFK